MGRPRTLAVGLVLGAMAVTGLWLALAAWRSASLPLGVSAVVLLLVAPALASAVLLARRDHGSDHEETAEGVLVAELHRADMALRTVRLGRGYMALAGSHLAVLWVCEAGGLISARDFLVIYSLIWLAVVAAYLPWLALHEKRIYEERALCRHLLGETRGGDGYLRPPPPLS